MKWITTTIKKKYFDEIKEGSKKIEYKECSEYWKKRLNPLIKSNEKKGINFLCGRECMKKEVLFIQYINVKWTVDINGKLCTEYFGIYLGNEIELD